MNAAHQPTSTNGSDPCNTNEKNWIDIAAEIAMAYVGHVSGANVVNAYVDDEDDDPSFVLWRKAIPHFGETRYVRVELQTTNRFWVVADSYIPWSDGRDVSKVVASCSDISQAAKIVISTLKNISKVECDFDGLLESEETGFYTRTRDVSVLSSF